MCVVSAFLARVWCVVFITQATLILPTTTPAKSDEKWTRKNMKTFSNVYL